MSTTATTGVKRVPRRKRGDRRTRRPREVNPEVSKANLATPILGCQLDNISGQVKDDLNINLTRQQKEIILAKTRKRNKNLPVLEIEQISYSLFSYDDLKEQAVFKVKNTNDQGLHSVNDPRSGVVENNQVCRTCHLDNLECPGHYGMIEMNEPFINTMFMRQAVDILVSVCNSCGGNLLTKPILEEKGIMNLNGSARLRAIADASKKVHCRRQHGAIGDNIIACTPNPVYKTSKIREMGKIVYTYDGKAGSDRDRDVYDIEKIFDAITEEDAEILGFSNLAHPRRLIVKAIPVIPICARAPAIQDGEMLKDDLTSMYIDIVRDNIKLGDPTLSEKDRDGFKRAMIFKISHMIDNTDAKYAQGPKKKYLGIKGRVQGKEAIIRQLIQGKRVDFSARTVLSPDPNLKFGEIRLPRVWAPSLTYPEEVSVSNIGRLTKLFKAGRITHITPNQGKYEGRKIKVNKRIIAEQNLSFGDVVTRWLQDGDRVVFNRQPTLHKQGIMGYKVVLGDPLTIGLHLSATTPHNADFDGDEGTIHAPQSREAMLEVALLMSINANILNSQNNKNIISVVMDSLTGSYLLTQPDTFIEKSVFSNIIGFLENEDGLATLNERLSKYHLPIYSGRALFSAILPEDFYYRKNDLMIRDGILVSGVLTSDHIGSSHGSIIQVMMKDYGQERTSEFLTDIYSITRQWLDVRGFSVGLDDCFLTGDDSEIEIAKAIQKAKMLVKSMGTKLDNPLEEERREAQIMEYLKGAKALGARISDKNLCDRNAFNSMAKSGAKGSVVNIAKITGILGQEFVQGQRMPETISGGRRCLPYFPEDSIAPGARGFCENSFLTGLTPSEFFFHSAGGREGLTDTAIKTAESGSLHHRIVKALEDIKVLDDGSTRNAFGFIYQFIYGEDGFDAGRLETVNTKTGTFASFINTKRLAGRMNMKYGFSTPGEPDINVIEPTPHPLMDVSIQVDRSPLPKI